jgi:hypothetical protein
LLTELQDSVEDRAQDLAEAHALYACMEDFSVRMLADLIRTRR